MSNRNFDASALTRRVGNKAVAKNILTKNQSANPLLDLFCSGMLLHRLPINLRIQPANHATPRFLKPGGDQPMNK